MYWDNQADAWMCHARSPESDPFFWKVILPSLLSIFPEPLAGAHVLDAGCGEGRLARECKLLGWDAVAVVDPSRQLILAASNGDQIQGAEGAVEALPFRDGSFYFVLCVMVLMSVKDVRKALEELRRVVQRPGYVVVAIVHPLSTAGELTGESTIAVKDYLRVRAVIKRVNRPAGSLAYEHEHRPISWYVNLAIDSGFTLTHLSEPGVTEIAEHARFGRWRYTPSALVMRLES